MRNRERNGGNANARNRRKARNLKKHRDDESADVAAVIADKKIENAS
jgi:hypothetical protein